MKRVSFSDKMVLALQNTQCNRWPPFPIDATGPVKGFTRRNHEKPKYEIGVTYAVGEGLFKTKEGMTAYTADRSIVKVEGKMWAWEWKRDRLPSIFMPVAVAREFIVFTQADIVILGDMKPMDLVYEGLLVTNAKMDGLYPQGWGAQEEYGEYMNEWRRLWEIINGKKSYRPDIKVVAYGFKRLDPTNL